MKKLSFKVVVLVPSDFNGSGYSRDQAVKEVEEYLSSLLGGCTSIQAKGCWINDNGELVEEDVTQVFSFTDRSYDVAIQRYAIEACKRWHQDCVAIELNNCLYLVSKDDIAL